jgi:hypothetical protein
MVFSKEVDSIIIANSCMEIECYGYQAMMAYTNNDLSAQKETQSKDETKKVEKTWVTNIGEQARQMKIHKGIYTN